MSTCSHCGVRMQMQGHHQIPGRQAAASRAMREWVSSHARPVEGLRCCSGLIAHQQFAEHSLCFAYLQSRLFSKGHSVFPFMNTCSRWIINVHACRHKPTGAQSEFYALQDAPGCAQQTSASARFPRQIWCCLQATLPDVASACKHVVLA